MKRHYAISILMVALTLLSACSQYRFVYVPSLDGSAGVEEVITDYDSLKAAIEARKPNIKVNINTTEWGEPINVDQ